MKTSVHERVMSLVRLAVSATANENEAHVAAMLVCQTILRYPTLLNTECLDGPSDSSEPEANGPYGRTGDAAQSRPPVKAHLEWETFKRDHRIEVRSAVSRSRCIACGEWYEINESVLQQEHIGITHETCADWWKKLNFATPVPAPDIEDLLV